MRIIGILSWYDERASWLAGVVAGLAKHAGIDHLIAVDGAYATYPEGKPYSSAQQQEAIYETCRNSEVGCTIYTPQEVWFGDEVAKRNHAWKLAEAEAEPNVDWYFICDADTFVVEGMGLRKALEETELDVGAVLFHEPIDGSWDPGGCYLRCVFRAIPGLRFEVNHFTYRLPDGRNLHDPEVVPADLSMVRVEHRTNWRDPWRREKQKRYYLRRDEARLEYPCGAQQPDFPNMTIQYCQLPTGHDGDHSAWYRANGVPELQTWPNVGRVVQNVEV